MGPISLFILLIAAWTLISGSSYAVPAAAFIAPPNHRFHETLLIGRDEKTGSVKALRHLEGRQDVLNPSSNYDASELKLAGRAGATKPLFAADVGFPNIASADPSSVQLVYLEDFGVSPSRNDNTDVFMDAVRACNRLKPCYVTFRTRTGSAAQPGPTYRFAGGTMYASLLIANQTDFVFDGAYSRLLFSRTNWTRIGVGWKDWTCSPDSSHNVMDRTLVWRRALMVLDHVDRAYLGRFTLDWDSDLWPLSFLVQVVAATPTSWTLRFVDWPKNVNNGRVDMSKIRGIRSLHLVDPVTGSFGVVNGTDIYSPQETGQPKTTFLDDTTVRFEFDTTTDRVPPASDKLRYLLRSIAYDAHAFVANQCNNCSFDSITVHACPGKLVVAQDGGTGLAITNLKSEIPPLSSSTPGNSVFPRHMSIASDGLFISGTNGKALVQNVDMSNLGDDCLNIHDVIAVDTSTAETDFPPKPLVYPTTYHDGIPWSVDLSGAKDTLILRSNFFAGFKPGDPVDFISIGNLETIYSSTLKTVIYDNCGTWRLVFPDPLPTQFYNTTTGRWLTYTGAGPALQNRRFLSSQNLIDRLSCSRNRARGVLLHTNDTIVSNSKLSQIAMACMFIRADLLEREGRGLDRVGVYGNIMEACDGNGWNAGAVDTHIWGMWSVVPWGKPRIGVRGVEMVGNVFRNLTRPALALSSTASFLFSDNSVSTSSLPIVVISTSTNATVTNNTFFVPLASTTEKQAVTVDSATTTNAIIGLNSFLSSASSQPPQAPKEFAVPIFQPFQPSIPVGATVLPASTLFTSTLAKLPQCKTCLNGVPDVDDTKECYCEAVAGGNNNGGAKPSGGRGNRKGGLEVAAVAFGTLFALFAHYFLIHL